LEKFPNIHFLISKPDFLVSNLKHEKNLPAIYIGRPTPLGNPFTHLYGVAKRYNMTYRPTPQDAVNSYYEWLDYEIMKQSPDVMNQLASIVREYKSKGFVRISCWCDPD